MNLLFLVIFTTTSICSAQELTDSTGEKKLFLSAQTKMSRGFVVTPTILNQTMGKFDNPKTKRLSLYNNDSSVVNWQLQIDFSDNSGWLTTEVYAGQLAAGQRQELSFTFIPSGLIMGTYLAEITIQTDDLKDQEIIIPVNLIVLGEQPDLRPIEYLDGYLDGANMFLFWQHPYAFEPTWINYSNVEIWNSIGTDDAINFDVAARWEPEYLEEYPNGVVTKIEFVPGEPDEICTYTLKIWQGEGVNIPELIYEQELTEVESDVWNEVELNEQVPVDQSKELWVGFNCNTASGFPAGCDDGPHTEGLSNMIFWEGEWVTLNSLNENLTYNWAVKAYLDNGDNVTVPGPEVLLGYNVYRNSQLFAEMITETQYVDYMPNSYDEYFVTVVYDEGESIPSNTVIVYSDQNQGREEVTNSKVHSETILGLNIFPNPVEDILTIESETKITCLELFDMNSLKVHAEKPAGNKIQINTSQLQPGIYTLQLETDDGMIVMKVVVK